MGFCGIGGQLQRSLMLLTVNLFIQGNECPSKGDALYDAVPGGGTSLLTHARPLMRKQKGKRKWGEKTVAENSLTE